MILVKILKRKDAASVMVAVVLALIISNMLGTFGFELANRLTMWEWGLSGAGSSESALEVFKFVYLQPIVSVLVQLILLELLARVVVRLRAVVVRRS